MMSEPEPKPSLSKLNDELLKPSSAPTEDPKRNSKEFLIERICSVAEENNLELSISNTKLKRMSKPRLQKMLGEMIEDVVKSEMAATVGAKSTKQIWSRKMWYDTRMIWRGVRKRTTVSPWTKPQRTTAGSCGT